MPPFLLLHFGFVVRLCAFGPQFEVALPQTGNLSPLLRYDCIFTGYFLQNQYVLITYLFQLFDPCEKFSDTRHIFVIGFARFPVKSSEAAVISLLSTAI